MTVDGQILNLQLNFCQSSVGKFVSERDFFGYFSLWLAALDALKSLILTSWIEDGERFQQHASSSSLVNLGQSLGAGQRKRRGHGARCIYNSYSIILNINFSYDKLRAIVRLSGPAAKAAEPDPSTVVPYLPEELRR